MSRHSPAHPSELEHSIAFAVVLWLMVMGVCVILANAWAANILID